MSQSNSLVPLCPDAALHELQKRPGLPFAEYLPAELIHRTARCVRCCFRERIYTPAVTLWTFLSQVLDADHSCRQAVARLLAYRTAQNLAPCSPDTGAYCKARKRLSEELLRELTCNAGSELHAKAPSTWLWEGRPVKITDGTGLSMPDTDDNRAAYPKGKTRQGRPWGGFPVMRLVVLFSLSVGTVLDAAFGALVGKGQGELSLWRRLQDRLDPGDVLLGDALYSNFWTIAYALARGADVVLRLPTKRAPWFGRGQRSDRCTRWPKPPRPEWMSQAEYAGMPQWLWLRTVHIHVRQAGFRTRQLVLITTLTDAAAVSQADLADLYRRRWQAELHLRSLKQTLQMDMLRSQTPQMARKEVWAHLLVYNLVRIVMAQAAAQARVRPDEVSFTGALQTINAFLPQMRSITSYEDAQALWEVILWAVGEHRVGDRPDRHEPRAVKRHEKKYTRLTQPRKAARQRLRRARQGAKKS
jgi:hypothetical protein